MFTSTTKLNNFFPIDMLSLFELPSYLSTMVYILFKVKDIWYIYIFIDIYKPTNGETIEGWNGYLDYQYCAQKVQSISNNHIITIKNHQSCLYKNKISLLSKIYIINKFFIFCILKLYNEFDLHIQLYIQQWFYFVISYMMFK